MTHIHTKSLWLLIATLLLSVFGARAQNSGSEAPWTVNPHDYKYDMTLYANIVFDGTPITDFSHYEVGAFVGDGCRRPRAATSPSSRKVWAADPAVRWCSTLHAATL